MPDQPLAAAALLLRRFAMRVCGVALALLGFALLGALATYSISDPSWNNATAAPVQNIGGFMGAVVADLFLQLIGGAALIIPLPMIFWGMVAARDGAAYMGPEKTPLHLWLRALAAPVCLLLAAGAMAALPVPASWPFTSGAGGLAGDGLLGLLPARAHGFAGLVSALLALSTLSITLGLTVERTENAAFVARQLARRAARRLRQLIEDAPHQMATIRREPTAEAMDGHLDRTEDDYAAGTDMAGTADGASDGASDGACDPAAQPVPTTRIIREEPAKNRRKREAREMQPDLPVFRSGTYELPTLNLLAKPPMTRRAIISNEALQQNARMLENVLGDFGVRGEIINVRPGPVVTLYELEPAAGVKSSRVIGLADDIARSMAAVAARVAVIPGRNAIGIELPNQDRETVYIRELLGADSFENSPGDLTLTLGKSIGGEPIFADLARMPHLLIAGTTGSGKSVGINTMILSLLYRLSPDECKMIMIDPKMLELSVYEGIPHLLAPVVTDPRKAVVALKWTVREMEERYRRMSKLGVRNIEGFNQRITEADATGEVLSRRVHTGYDSETNDPIYETEELDYAPMPFIVVVIDEVADLMMVAGKDIEAMVQRLAQMARAAGIHLIMATQRPSVDVITGTIKANFPTRISFQVTSKIDSRTILGEQGAEQLLGMGDMLHMAGGGRIKRVHGAFVSDDEVEKVVKFLKKQGKPDYVQEVTEMADGDDAAMAGLDIGGNTSSGDALYDKAVAVVARDRKASTSYIQRRLQIGYNRAATLIERMEEDGVISPANHAGKRDILIGEDAA